MNSRPIGRPRAIRSKPSSGSGAHELSTNEKQKLCAVAIDYGRDEEDNFAALLEKIWLSYTRYLAIEMAEANKPSANDESTDVKAIIVDAAFIREMLTSKADLADAFGCVAPAVRFAERLDHFPRAMAAETTRRRDALEFMLAHLRLAQSIVSVRSWSERRETIVSDIDLIVGVCKALP